MIATLLLPAAGAADVGVGAGVVVNDPFLLTSSLRAVASVPLAPSLRISGHGAVYPSLGENDWKPLTTQVRDTWRVSPDISRHAWTLAGTLDFEPFRGEVGGWPTALGVCFGAGVVRTLDDLEALSAEDDPAAQSTERQLHITQDIGAYSELGLHPGVSLRARWHMSTFTEVVMGTTMEMKQNVHLITEVVLHTR